MDFFMQEENDIRLNEFKMFGLIIMLSRKITYCITTVKGSLAIALASSSQSLLFEISEVPLK